MGFFSFGRSRNANKLRRAPRRKALGRLESLEQRQMLTVSASFSPASGLLTVVGDQLDNNIEISRTAGGDIVVNGGTVAIAGGTPTVANTNVILASGLDGDDQITLNETGGPLPQATLLGGDGNDTLTGGAAVDTLLGGDGNDLLRGGAAADQLFGGMGNDTLLGDRGNDHVEGQEGSDLLIWNSGDGSDLLEGGIGNDFVQVNGANGAGDDFSIDPNGDRVRFQRNNLGLFTLDIGTTENLDVNGQGGSDVIVGSVGLNGLIELDLDGGEGNDLLIGGDGADVLRGGAGNDTLLGNRGNDISLGEGGDDLLIWNDDDGSDFLEGGADIDTVQVNGSNIAGDDFSIDPNGDRVRFQRNNLGLFTLNIGTTENLDVNGQGGSDVIIGSVGLNGLIDLDLDGGEGNDLLIGGDGPDVLRGGAGNDTLLGARGNDIVLAGDGSDLLIWNNGDGDDFLEGGADTDTVQVNGSNTDGDNFRIDPNGERVRLRRTNLSSFSLDIGATENLDVNGQGGGDVIAGAIGLNGLINLDLDGGEGNDLLIGGDGPDVLRGGAGNDTLQGREGNDTLLTGDGNDTLQFAGPVGDDAAPDFVPGAGTDDVIVLAGYGPALDSFSDANARTTTNGFASRVNLGAAGSLSLAAILPGMLAADDYRFVSPDYNGNGLVDAADYTVWRDARGTRGLPAFSGADGNGDGAVTEADLAVWREHFGQTMTPLAIVFPVGPGVITPDTPTPDSASLLSKAAIEDAPRAVKDTALLLLAQTDAAGSADADYAALDEAFAAEADEEEEPGDIALGEGVPLWPA